MIYLSLARIRFSPNSRVAGETRRPDAHVHGDVTLIMWTDSVQRWSSPISVDRLDISLTLNMPRYFPRSRQSWLNDVIWRPFYLHGLTSIPILISNYTHYKVWGEITYPFPKSSSCAVEDVEWVSNFIPHWVWMLGFKLNHVSKSAPGDKGWCGITDNYRDFVKNIDSCHLFYDIYR